MAAAMLVAVLALPSWAWNWNSGPAPASPWGAAVSPLIPLQDVEVLVHHLTNEARRQQGCPPLAHEGYLMGAARQHSADMLQRGFFSHVTPEGWSLAHRLPPALSPQISASGENIWLGSGHNPGDPQGLARMIVAGWMSSPGHRQNILDPAYTHLGVGITVIGREIRATQMFAQINPGKLYR